ncbi:hypothetical protein AVEN_271680-1 [Araneus ventricosus]|uniref:Uncharacterized protein n=1 Tax=Araneus ventricosus TaxID=182803 RepID=A0A4Y2JAL7_ARAVE|nr:hypothetical protein AVEN_271680-1 [Araneus ventricosus]
MDSALLVVKSQRQEQAVPGSKPDSIKNHSSLPVVSHFPLNGQVVHLEPCPSGVPWCMTTTWSTTYVVEKCDVMWKLPHPVLTGGSE